MCFLRVVYANKSLIEGLNSSQLLSKSRRTSLSSTIVLWKTRTMPAGSLRHEDVITCLPTGLVSCYAVFAGFVASHSVCSHDSRPENPSGEGTAETEVSPDRKGGRMGKSRGRPERKCWAVLQEKHHLHSSATAATAWACVGTGPMTVGPWEPPMSACLCLRPRLRWLRLSLPSLKTSAVCRCLSGT